MSDPIIRIPDPVLPEHKLMREVGALPELSSGLRDRVLVDVRRQVRMGRWADRLRIVAAVCAASVLCCLIWKYRWTGQDSVTHQNEAPAKTSPADLPVPSANGYTSDSENNAKPVEPKKPQGGPSDRSGMKELQQLNQLIDDIQGRKNQLCSLLPVL
jgi:hypothetical protein